jgi:DNA repair protein RadA/Sms
MSQVIEVSTVLSRVAKERGIPMILIGQVTKDGNIAGPRTVEHLVDVVLHFEGDRDSSLRILRGIKNRYGPSDEIGCFEHTGSGIIEVPDPSGLLLGRREAPVSGVATAIIIEGMRPLPVEVQALVNGSALPVPRRAVSGLDLGRTTMVQAILERHGKVRLSDKDVFASTIGGMRTREPSIDLATAIALDSATTDYALPLGVIVIGEVTLSGEVRQVPGIERRLNEAARLGFTRAIIPSGSKVSVKGMGVSKVSTIVEALAIARGLT